MRPEIGDYLRSQGISRLYSHQAEMFVRAGEGEKPGHHDSDSKWQNFELFAAGIAEDFRESADACDFIYPTKALASDQYRVLAPVLEYFGEGVYRQGSMMEIRCLQNAAGSGRVRILS